MSLCFLIDTEKYFLKNLLPFQDLKTLTKLRIEETSLKPIKGINKKKSETLIAYCSFKLKTG